MIRGVLLPIITPFDDYILSAEGAELVADHGRIPARSRVKSKFETLNQPASGTVAIQVLTTEDAYRLRQPTDKLLKDILLRR